MQELYLARHGQDEDNLNGILNGRRDEPLTELGISQAQKLAAHIKTSGVVFDQVFSSPLQRAYKTAEIATDCLGLPKPEKEMDLIERDFGVMTGQPANKILEMCSPHVLVTEKINFFLCPSGAETFPQLIDRANRLLAKLKISYPDKKLLLVTHGDLGQMVYAAYYNLPWEQVLKQFHFNNSDLLLLAPSSKAEDSHVFTTVVDGKINTQAVPF